MTAALRGLYAITDTPLLAGGKLLPCTVVSFAATSFAIAHPVTRLAPAGQVRHSSCFGHLPDPEMSPKWHDAATAKA